MTRKILFALLLASLPLCAATPSKTLKNLDATVLRTLQTFNVPGISLAIVHDGQSDPMPLWPRGWAMSIFQSPQQVNPSHPPDTA